MYSNAPVWMQTTAVGVAAADFAKTHQALPSPIIIIRFSSAGGLVMFLKYNGCTDPAIHGSASQD